MASGFEKLIFEQLARVDFSCYPPCQGAALAKHEAGTAETVISSTAGEYIKAADRTYEIGSSE